MKAVVLAVALARARAVVGDEDNHGNTDGRGSDNNQLISPAEEKMAAAMVLAMETAMVT